MARENVQGIVENSIPVVAKEPTDDGRGEIEKAIQLTELQRDLADLQRQSFGISGAIQYIQQKIAQLKASE